MLNNYVKTADLTTTECGQPAVFIYNEVDLFQVQLISLFDPGDTFFQAIAPVRDFKVKFLLDFVLVHHAVKRAFGRQRVILGFDGQNFTTDAGDFVNGFGEIVPACNTFV
jgi:hypothetical protein